MPARRAISSVEAPWRPSLGELLERGVEDLLAPLLLRSSVQRDDHGSEVSDDSQACQGRPATRSSSASVSRVWNGSASARSNTRSAPGEVALVAVGAEERAARRCRSAPRSPARAARRARGRGRRPGRRRPASRARRPRRRAGSSTGRSREALGVAGGDARARREQLVEAAEPAGCRPRRGCPRGGS